MPRKPQPLKERFLERVAFGPGCHEWQGCKNEHGYGLIGAGGRGGKVLKAHRVAYELEHGPITDSSIHVRHKCHNPGCVNPRHLELGSHQDNMRDRELADRTSKGEKHSISKLTETQVLEIRSLLGNVSQRKIAVMYGVSRGAIDGIHRGLNWKSV